KIVSTGIIAAINLGSNLGVIENIPIIKNIPLPTAVKERLFQYIGKVIVSDEEKKSSEDELEYDSYK
ncbi:hypothetical protein, partial [Salmonella sp. s51228]|uniref:hypothetical protein n=1 Tax=Salmonella sp. s51228 TaxID=3159652 RepID=UPI00397FB365